MVGMAVGVDYPGEPPALLVQAFGQGWRRAAGSMRRASLLSGQATR